MGPESTTSPDPPTEDGRSIFRFVAQPASLLIASFTIIMVTAATVLLGALVIYAFDETEFETYGQALWFTLQTATTVGYGDVTPQRAVGRVVAAGVMLVTLGLLTVLSATITSSFVQRGSRAKTQSNHDELVAAIAHLHAAVLALGDRLDTATTEATSIDGAASATIPDEQIRPGSTPTWHDLG
jgi:voltage-gated potassium channel